MEDRIKEIIHAKIKESIADTHRINEIIKVVNNSVKNLSINDALMLGIIIGRVYN